MKRRFVTIVSVILVLLTLAVAGHNMCANDNFLNVSVAQILTLLVAISISYFASHFRNDQRKAKEHAEDIIQKIQSSVMDESFYKIPADGCVDEIKIGITTRCRRINNLLSALKKYGEHLGFKKEVAYIDAEFQKYKSTTGDHILDPLYLSKTESEFRKIAENIDSKCDAIIIDLYL